MNEHDEIINLNAEYLDIDELERRLELALGAPGLDAWVCGVYVDCPELGCPGLCAGNCPDFCAGNCASLIP